MIFKHLSPIIIIGLIFISCKKEDENNLNEKIMDENEKAFVGNWIEYKTLTWDYSDNSFETNTFDELKITKNKWKINESTIPYEIYYNECWYTQPVIIFNPNSTPDTTLIHTSGDPKKLDFKYYEYPSDPDVFRIDHHYTSK
jgi:hypothetical protein